MKPARVCVVTDDDRWAAAVSEALLPIRTVPEVVSWKEASQLEEPSAALVAYVDHLPCDKLQMFELWSRHAWQPSTAVCLRLVRRSAVLAEHLSVLGYMRISFLTEGPPTPEEVVAVVKSLVERRLWVCGLLARTLGYTGPNFVHVLTRALDCEVPASTVTAWAKRCNQSGLDICTLADLERFMRRAGVPTPKAVLDRIRLLQVMAHACSNGRQTRDQLARRFGYSSGDFLGRQARRLTGISFGELRPLDLDAVAGLFAS